MKDYRLSEIKNADLTELAGNVELTHIKFLLKESTIEPRDMIELPCKEKRVDDRGISFWRIIYRGEKGLRLHFSNTEFEADAFLADLKRGK